MSELGVSSEIQLPRLARLGFSMEGATPQRSPLTRGQQGTQGCSRGYEYNAALSDDASTTTLFEYMWSCWDLVLILCILHTPMIALISLFRTS
jgi:hypothetical protein